MEIRFLNYKELRDFDFNTLKIGEAIAFENYYGKIPQGCVLEDIIYNGHSAQSIRRVAKDGEGKNLRVLTYNPNKYDDYDVPDKKPKQKYDGGYAERGLSRNDFI